MHNHTDIQWNLSTKDTIGTSWSVHNIEVSLFWRLISTITYYIGTLRSVPIMEVSLFQSVLSTDVRLYLQYTPSCNSVLWGHEKSRYIHMYSCGRSLPGMNLCSLVSIVSLAAWCIAYVATAVDVYVMLCHKRCPTSIVPPGVASYLIYMGMYKLLLILLFYLSMNQHWTFTGITYSLHYIM